jgi:hypothetical protein
MTKYSSVLFGAERFEKVGPFRFPVWNELVPGELRGFEQIARKQAKSTFKSIKLAQKIGAERGISTQQAIDLLSSLNEEANQEILYQYAEELDEIQNNTMSDYSEKLEHVTLFMRYRGEVKMPGSKDYVQTKDWSPEDTDNMPSELLDQIYALIIKERDGWDSESKKESDTAPTS